MRERPATTGSRDPEQPGAGEKPQGLKPLSYMERWRVGAGGYVGAEAATPKNRGCHMGSEARGYAGYCCRYSMGGERSLVLLGLAGQTDDSSRP
jgi:hypothetical protein